MNVTDLKAQFSDTISLVGTKLKDSLSFLKDMKEAGVKKLKALVNDILGLNELISLPV